MKADPEAAQSLNVVARHWGQRAKPEEEARRRLTGWMNHPWVEQEYINRQVSGHPNQNWLMYAAHKYFQSPVPHALSLGCGSGGLERHALQLGIAERFDANDVSPDAISVAQRLLIDAGFGGRVNYTVADLNRPAFTAARYGAAFASMSIHHVENLKLLLQQVHHSLLPGSFFVMNEYIGPTQFQWTDAQLAAAADILSCLPEDLRVHVEDATQRKDRIDRPSLEEMDRIDPSEAIRSADIVPTALNYFELVERIDYGGTLLHLVMKDIAGNFEPNKPEHVAMLKLMTALESALIRYGALTSDFSFLVFRRT